MPSPSALVCVRCSARYAVDRFADDCPACRSAGAPANLTVAYDATPGAGLGRNDLQRRPRSMWRWDAFLPAAAGDAVSLGEGDTPLLEAPNLGLGDVWIKDESRNPTWSFKDRLASGALTHGQALRRQGHRLELVGQCRRCGRRLRREGRPAVHRLHLRRLGRSAGAADARLWRHGGEGQRQGRSLAPAVAGRARVRLVSDLAVLRSRGRQQSLRHGRLQDDRLRDRRGVRLDSRPTGACCRSATATRCTACGRASRT